MKNGKTGVLYFPIAIFPLLCIQAQIQEKLPTFHSEINGKYVNSTSEISQIENCKKVPALNI